MMRFKTVTAAEAAAHRKRVMSAPELAIGEEELTVMVQRVGFLPPQSSPTPFLETTDGKIYRLPLELSAWAFDTVAVALQRAPGIFPTPVKFGRLRSRIWAEIL